MAQKIKKPKHRQGKIKYYVSTGTNTWIGFSTLKGAKRYADRMKDSVVGIWKKDKAGKKKFKEYVIKKSDAYN